MEKAILKITKTKKGDFITNVVFENNKMMPVSDFRPKDDSLNNKEVMLERHNGQVVKIIFEGREIYSKGSAKSVQQGKFQKNIKKENIEPANYSILSKAPYNFVPLNDRLVQAESLPDYDKYHHDRYTGYIEIEIEALTPVYIRDTLTEDEYREKNRIEEQRKANKKIPSYCNPDFFSPGGLIRIPGSSLRGMIRTLVEIVSFGKFGFFDNRRLYYRSFADRCKNFRLEYQKHAKNPKAGILIKEGFDYYIITTNYCSIPKSLTARIIGKKPEYFNFYSTRFNNKEGYIVVSGPMDSKKVDWFIEKIGDNRERIHLTEADIKDYKNDKERRAVIDLIEELNKKKDAKRQVPCFYSEYLDLNGKKRIAFGHTKNFRIPYQKTIGDHIFSQLKKDLIDITEAIFGNEKTHSSRVFFEDAYLKDGQNNVLMEKATPKILSTPKPTTFQHYLEQLPYNLTDFPNNLANYNSNNAIRGNKLYWHREANDWIETNENNIEKHSSQYTRITPVKEDTVFKARIRFENLSEVELGALLFALQLPEECAHKIGMAKPLGLGSIKITPRLYLSNRLDRYRDLFSEWENILPEDVAKIGMFKEKFEKYVLSCIGEPSLKTLWDMPRLKELKRMLDDKNKLDNSETKYLEPEESKARKVLPKPTDIK